MLFSSGSLFVSNKKKYCMRVILEKIEINIENDKHDEICADNADMRGLLRLVGFVCFVVVVSCCLSRCNREGRAVFLRRFVRHKIPE